MSVIAFHEAAAVAAGPALNTGNGRRRLCRYGLSAMFVLTGLALFASTPAIAQYNGGGTYGRSVIVNPEVLNSLGAGGGVSGLPYRPGSQAIYNPTVPYNPYGQNPQAAFPVARPGTLLFPPPQRPRSQVLTQGQPNYQGQYQSQYRTPFQSRYQNPYAAVPSAQGYLPPQPNVTDQARSQLLVPAPSPSSTPAVASTANQVPAAPAVPQTTVAEPVAVQTSVPAAPAPVPSAAPEPEPVEETTLVAVPQAPSTAAPAAAAAAAPAPAPPPVPDAPAETEQVQTLAAEPETALPAAVAAPSPPAEVATATVSPPAEPAAEELPPPPPEVEEAEVPAAPAAETAEPAPQTAALAPAAEEALAARVLFSSGSADLTPDGKGELQKLARSLNEDETLRVQLLAFASGDGDEANAARRLSLSRALVVRGFLIDQGIPSTRMQVRALGNKFESGPPDRVDIHPQNS